MLDVPWMAPQAKCANASWVRAVSPECNVGPHATVPSQINKSTPRNRTKYEVFRSPLESLGKQAIFLGTFLWWPDETNETKGSRRKWRKPTPLNRNYCTCRVLKRCKRAWIWCICKSWLTKTEDFRFCMLSFLQIWHVWGRRWKWKVYTEPTIPFARASSMCWFSDMILSLSTFTLLLLSVDRIWFHLSQMQQPPSSSEATREMRWSSEARARDWGCGEKKKEKD